MARGYSSYNYGRNPRRKAKVVRRKTVKKGHRLPLSRMPKAMLPEFKHFIDNTWTAETIDDISMPSINGNIMQVAQGDNYNNRNGDQIFAKSLCLRITTTQSTSESFDFYRIDLVRDSQPHAGTPVWTDVYWAGGSTDTDSINAPLEPAHRDRFKIIRSKVVCEKLSLGSLSLSSGSGTAVSVPTIKQWVWYVPINKRIRYAGTGALEPTSGANYLLFAWSVETSNTPKIYASTELVFTDV